MVENRPKDPDMVGACSGNDSTVVRVPGDPGGVLPQKWKVSHEEFLKCAVFGIFPCNIPQVVFFVLNIWIDYVTAMAEEL